MKFNSKLITQVALVFSFASVFASYSFADEILKKTKDSISKGKAVYVNNCTSCHGDKGDGNGPTGASLTPKPRNFNTEEYAQGGSPQEVYDTITTGFTKGNPVKGIKPNPLMMAFGHLSKEDRSNVAYYILSMKAGAPAKAKK